MEVDHNDRSPNRDGPMSSFELSPHSPPWGSRWIFWQNLQSLLAFLVSEHWLWIARGSRVGTRNLPGFNAQRRGNWKGHHKRSRRARRSPNAHIVPTGIGPSLEFFWSNYFFLCFRVVTLQRRQGASSQIAPTLLANETSPHSNACSSRHPQTSLVD